MHHHTVYKIPHDDNPSNDNNRDYGLCYLASEMHTDTLDSLRVWGVLYVTYYLVFVSTRSGDAGEGPKLQTNSGAR